MLLIDLVILITGMCFGSFLNVVIYRVPVGKSIVAPRSACMNCGHQIKWWENIPVLSYLLLRGRCSSCGTSFSIRYPLVEFLTGVLVLLLFYRFGLTAGFVFYSIFICILIAITFIDLDHFIIPDSLLIAGIIPALYPMFRDGYTGISGYVTGSIVLGMGFLAIQYLGKLAFKQDAMGWGDVKFAFLLGLLFGWEEGILAVMLAFFSSALIIIALMATGKPARGQRLPFGPFLSIGAVITIFYGPQIITWYLTTFFNKG